jgi:hypothetical protein
MVGLVGIGGDRLHCLRFSGQGLTLWGEIALKYMALNAAGQSVKWRIFRLRKT